MVFRQQRDRHRLASVLVSAVAAAAAAAVAAAVAAVAAAVAAVAAIAAVAAVAAAAAAAPAPAPAPPAAAALQRRDLRRSVEQRRDLHGRQSRAVHLLHNKPEPLRYLYHRADQLPDLVQHVHLRRRTAVDRLVDGS